MNETETKFQEVLAKLNNTVNNHERNLLIDTIHTIAQELYESKVEECCGKCKDCKCNKELSYIEDMDSCHAYY